MSAAGLSAILYGLFVVRVYAAKTRQWPTVTGTILSSDVSSSRSGGGMTSANTHYKADVEYEYRVQGRRYKNDVIKPFGQLQLSISGHALKLAEQYSPGDEVDVFYNPSKPTKSCLDCEEEISIFYIGIGAIFLIAGWYF